MSPSLPNGHRLFRDVRDELGPKAMLAHLVAGELVAVIWDIRSGDQRDVPPKHWLSSAADYTIQNASFYSKHPNQEILLVRELVPKSEPKTRPAKNRGGHPGKWNWPGAAGFAAAYIVENDYPGSQGEMVTVIASWFNDTVDDQPDERQIERFVSELYKWGKT